jgi:hypothetical protein
VTRLVKTLSTSKDGHHTAGKQTGPATVPVSVTLSLHPVKEPANRPKTAANLSSSNRVGLDDLSEPRSLFLLRAAFTVTRVTVVAAHH